MKNKVNSRGKINLYPLYFISFVVIAVLPALVVPPYFQATDWDRSIIFRIIIWFLIGITAINYLINKELPLEKNPRELIGNKKVKILFGALFVWIVINILASLLSIDLFFSAFGSPSRGGGLVTTISLFLFSLMAFFILKENDWIRVWKAALWAGIVMCFIAIFQAFRIFPNIFISNEISPPSTTGNSTFLAMYMVFLCVLSVVLALKENNLKTKIFYSVAFCLFLFTILITGARAVYLAMGIAIFFFIFFYPGKIKKVKVSLGILLSLVLIGVLAINFSPTVRESLHNSSFGEKIAERISLQTILEDLVETRFSAWKIGWQGFQDRPFLGWGPENFSVGFDKHYDPSIENIANIWWDRAHNIIVDTAVTTGMVGLIGYLSLVGAFFWVLQKMRAREPFWAHALQAGLIGYFVSNIFNFDSFITYLMFYFFLAFAMHLAQEKRIEPVVVPKRNSGKFAAALFIIIAIFMIFPWGIFPYLNNHQIALARRLSDHQLCDRALEINEETREQKRSILDSYRDIKYIDIIRKCLQPNSPKINEYTNRGYETLKKASALRPTYTRNWIYLAGFINGKIAQEKDEIKREPLIREIRETLSQAYTYNPSRQEIFAEEAKLELLLGNYQKMKEVGEQCISLGEYYGGCFWYLGLAQVNLGKYEEGKENMTKAKELGYPVLAQGSLIQLSNVYLKTNNYKELEWIYEELYALNPESANYGAHLAFIYKEQGKYSEAIRVATEVLNKSPGSKEEVEAFLVALLDIKGEENNAEYHTSLAMFYRAAGYYDKARTEAIKAYNIWVSLPEVRNNPEQMEDAKYALDQFLKSVR